MLDFWTVPIIALSAGIGKWEKLMERRKSRKEGWEEGRKHSQAMGDQKNMPFYNSAGTLT